MTRTENYQLNQWEPTDKISREDFNADNAKIDAAIKRAHSVETLFDVTLQETATALELDLSDIDLTQYTYVDLFVSLKGDAWELAKIRLNGLSDCYYYYSTKFTSWTSYYPCFFDAGVSVEGVIDCYGYLRLHTMAPFVYAQEANVEISQNEENSYGGNYASACPGLGYQDLRTIQFVLTQSTEGETHHLLPGGQIKLLGVRV